MPNPETSQPVPFEVPSGLPEVIQELRRLIGDQDVSISLSPLFMETAKYLTRIPAMAEEIGRLKSELAVAIRFHEQDAVDYESLRALNSELREALTGALYCIGLCPSAAEFPEIAKARAILAKSEATAPETSSATPGRCGPDLPAQDIPRQPAPGGTSTESEAL